MVLFAFLQIGTNRRAFLHPMAIDEATGHVRSWLQRSVTDLLVLDESDLLRAMEWLDVQGAGASLTTGAQIATAPPCIPPTPTSNASTVYTGRIH